MNELRTQVVAGAPSAANASGSLKSGGIFLAIAFSISWTLWLCALRLGAHAGVGEEFLGFGSCGPAVAAMLLAWRARKVHSVTTILRFGVFGVLWLSCWAIYVFSDKLRGVTPHLFFRFLVVVAVLAAIPALVATRLLFSGPREQAAKSVSADQRSWPWRFVAFFAFPVLLLVPTLILHPLGMPLVQPQRNGSAIACAGFGTLMLMRNFFFTAAMEEPGWRGFLLARLQSRFSPLLATLLTWLPWALWHLPLDISGGLTHTWINYMQLRVIFLIPVAIIFTWLYNRSGGDIWTVMIFHACMNTFPFFLPYVQAALALVFVWAGYAVIADRMWRQNAVAVGQKKPRPSTTQG